MAKLKLIVAAMSASMLMPGAAIADPDLPTEPPPQACGCDWISSGPNGEYGWVCSNPPRCIEIAPD